MTFRELEEQGIKLEQSLRGERGKESTCDWASCLLNGPWGGGRAIEPASCLRIHLLSLPPGTQAELKTQWINQLLHLVQKKNNLVSEESDLMIA